MTYFKINLTKIYINLLIIIYINSNLNIFDTYMYSIIY